VSPQYTSLSGLDFATIFCKVLSFLLVESEVFFEESEHPLINISAVIRKIGIKLFFMYDLLNLSYLIIISVKSKNNRKDVWAKHTRQNF
jgi:uncharacterized Tic20 family protein